MIYLILDTNIWLYISNGYDPVNNNFTKGVHTDAHFELLKSLKNKIENKKITILINEIILSEFERNKATSYALINEVKKQERDNLKKIQELKPYLDKATRELELEKIKNDVVSNTRIKIDKNEEHIREVERFLRYKCIKISIVDQHYIDAAKLAILKKAPFHNNKNNIADAIILLSVIDYLKSIKLNDINHAIFVSNNITEYANSLSDKEIQFHQDILGLLNGQIINYKRYIWEAIDLSDELIEELQYYYEYKDFVLADKKFWCVLPYCNTEGGSFGYLESAIKVFNSADFSFNVNQLTLFEFTEEERANLTNVRQTEMGKCTSCDTMHLLCPNCGKLACDPEEIGSFFCTECNSEFEIRYHSLLKENVLAIIEEKNRIT